MRRSFFLRSPRSDEGLYRRPALTWLEIHSPVSRALAPVAALAMCARLVPQPNPGRRVGRYLEKK